MASSTMGHTLTIGGVKVQFPVKPYPSQLSMMDKIIKGLERSQNCLLESPTGSGKSLALLCSALAWQKAFREKIINEEKNEKQDHCGGESATKGEYYLKNQTDGPNDDDESDDDFKPLHKVIKTATGAQVGITMPGQRNHVTVEYEDKPAEWTMERTSNSATDDPCCNKEEEIPKKNRPKVPVIWFGTRTHKQIAQIAKELGRTAYKNARMCILASREHTCIDPVISKGPKKNEECKNKLDGPGCHYKDKSRLINHGMIRKSSKLSSAWDLEDFVNFCRGKRACPYYGARELKQNADIIFCPYNYLVDPHIREAMEINLKEQIVILDEAHNIEDSARESASNSTELEKLKDASEDLNKMISERIKLQHHIPLRDMVDGFIRLIDDNGKLIEGGANDYQQQSKTWSGYDIVALLQMAGAGPHEFGELKKHFAAVSETDENASREEQLLKLHASTLQALGGLFMVIDNIYRDNFRYRDDYRVVLVKTMSYFNQQTNNRWLKRNKNRHQVHNFSFTLNFWCMNPAVAFAYGIGDVVRSVILTSGTLSPMDSFQSELGVPFPIQLEASHVISAKQVWVGTISKGPRGGNMLGSYQNAETFSYQDELGLLTLQVCQTIPHGVLLFLSSYKMLEKLLKRWRDTGLYDKLSEYKEIMQEPRGSDSKADFDELMNRFYAIIEETQHNDLETGHTGALFMAVCRGKVSEGLDFANNNARAVITVGIPFPNVKDRQVELKKQYNNQHSASRGLLTGNAWYEIQAYRALNQALGRCIRHRYDWGALILVDERFAKNPNRYIKGLSKWVRQKVKYYSTFQQARLSLEDFTKGRLEADPNVEPTLSTSCLEQSSMMVEMPSYMAPNTPRFKQPPLAAAVKPATPQTPVMNAFHHLMPHVRKNTPTASETVTVSDTSTPIHTPQMKRTSALLPRYMSISQAGGFMPTEDEPAVSEPSVERPVSPPMDLNVSQFPSQFNPTVTSTQAPRRLSSQKPTPFPDLVSPVKGILQHDKSATHSGPTSNKPNLSRIKNKLSQFAFNKCDEPEPVKKENQTPQKTPIKNALTQDNLRSESPDLFDEELNLGAEDGAKNRNCDDSGKYEKQMAAKRPLFKRKDSDSSDNDVLVISAAVEGSDVNRDKRNRLSRRSSSFKSSQQSEEKDLNQGPGRYSLRKQTPSKRELETKTRTSAAIQRRSESNGPESRDIGGAIDKLLGESEARNKENQEFSATSLKTRRALHGKRRRTPSKETRNKRKQSVSEGIATSGLRCEECETEIFQADTGFREETDVPHFCNTLVRGPPGLTVLYTSENSVPINKGLLGPVEQTGEVDLNSWFSEEDQCCVQYLRCLCCAKSSASGRPVAVQVKLASYSSKYHTGQIWFSGSATHTV